MEKTKLEMLVELLKDLAEMLRGPASSSVIAANAWRLALEVQERLTDAISDASLAQEEQVEKENRHGDIWHSFECLDCQVSFDVRASPIEKAACPLCIRMCECRTTWEADPNGYGSRGDKAISQTEVLGILGAIRIVEGMGPPPLGIGEVGLLDRASYSAALNDVVETLRSHTKKNKEDTPSEKT